MLIDAWLNMRGRIAFAERLLDFVFDRAGDLVAFFDVPIRRHHDVKIDPVIAPAVAMTKLMIAADLRRFGIRANV